MMRLSIAFSFLTLAACSGEEAPPPAPAPVPAPAPPPPPPAPAKPAVMDPAALNAARDANVGQMVTVKGVVAKVTKQASNVDVDVAASDAADADWIRCTTTDLAMADELTALAPKSEISVMGKVDAAPVDGKTHLVDCAPAEGGAMRGGKAKAGDGMEGPAKAGKEKAGKQKAH